MSQVGQDDLIDDDEIDAALDRLRQPTTVELRLSVLERLVAYWHGSKELSSLST